MRDPELGSGTYSIGSKPEAQEPGWRFGDLFQSYKPICLARKGLIFSYTDPRREESEALLKGGHRKWA